VVTAQARIGHSRATSNGAREMRAMTSVGGGVPSSSVVASVT